MYFKEVYSQRPGSPETATERKYSQHLWEGGLLFFVFASFAGDEAKGWVVGTFARLHPCSSH